jgi:hypothetical protein
MDNFGMGRLGFTDRPTLTFAPQRSLELTRALLTQVNLDTLYLFSKEGWGPERVVRLFVRTINGIDNATSGGGPVPADPPEFAEYRALSDLLASLGRRRAAILTTQDHSADLTDIVPVAARPTPRTRARSRRMNLLRLVPPWAVTPVAGPTNAGSDFARPPWSAARPL